MAGVTPILKRPGESRGKRLIPYTGPIARAIDARDLRQSYSRQMRTLERGTKSQQGGLVYVLPAGQSNLAAAGGGGGGGRGRDSRYYPPSSAREVFSSSSETGSEAARSPRTALIRAPTSTSSGQTIQLVNTSNGRERFDPSATHLPPGAILLSQLELGQRAALPARSHHLTTALQPAQNAQALVPTSTGFIVQPQTYVQGGLPLAQMATVPSTRLADSSGPSSSPRAAQQSVKHGVHFEDDRPPKYDRAEPPGRLYDDIGGGRICWPDQYGGRSGSSGSVGSTGSKSSSGMCMCLQVVFHILSLLMSIVAITLSILMATGHIAIPRTRSEQAADISNNMGHTQVLENPWRASDQLARRPDLNQRMFSPGGMPRQLDQSNRVARIGVLWQKLEDLQKSSLGNAQSMHSNQFAQDKLTAQLERLEAVLGTKSQAVELLSTSYTHWGRKLCPAGKQHNGTIHMAYSGVVAGPSDTLPGSAANALCMPLRPQWRGFDDQRHYGGRIYGATYRLGVLTEGTYNVFDGNAEPGRLNRQAVPCAVCRVRRATTVLHLPATRECPSGFRRLYDGYLLSAAAAQFKSQYLCVDKRPEFSPVRRQQAHAGTPEMSLYPVEAGCSDKLPCQQFPGSRELTCVVCVA